jgi:DNA repair exonuclease SbcCD ATPase subunit
LEEKEATERAWASERRLEKVDRELKDKEVEAARLEKDQKARFDDMTSVKAELKAMEEKIKERETKVKNIDRKLSDLNEVSEGLDAEIARKREELKEMDREVEKREQILRQTTRSLKSVRLEVQGLVVAAARVRDESGMSVSTSPGPWQHGMIKFGACPGCGKPVLQDWAICPSCAQRW